MRNEKLKVRNEENSPISHSSFLISHFLLFSLFIFLLFPANTAFAQTSASLIDTKKYAEIFGFENGNINLRSNYIWSASDDDIVKYGALNFDSSTMGITDDTRILTDIPLEFALLSYYSPELLSVRPAAADAILPANNPRLADQKLGAAVFQEMQILRFLNDTAALARHQAVFQYITSRGNATAQEIETFYRNNIRALISDIVDEQVRGLNVRINNEILSAIKNAVTNFMITPNSTTYNSLLQAYRRYTGDGAVVLGRTMLEINYDVAEAISFNKTIGQ